MDEIVKAALRKWPNVPACYNWLALDGRGDWYMRDDRVQACGPFPYSKGSRIEHEKLKQFIARNYLSDEQGNWFFQNGPQRVYVDLEAAPLVLSISQHDCQFEVSTHLQTAGGAVSQAFLDEHGRLFLATEAGLGLVRSLDMCTAADAIEAGLWQPEEIEFASLPQKFAYNLLPHPPQSS